MKGLSGYRALFGEITPEELEAIEARRVAYESKISDFQKRPTNDSETETENNILRA